MSYILRGLLGHASKLYQFPIFPSLFSPTARRRCHPERSARQRAQRRTCFFFGEARSRSWQKGKEKKKQVLRPFGAQMTSALALREKRGGDMISMFIDH